MDRLLLLLVALYPPVYFYASNSDYLNLSDLGWVLAGAIAAVSAGVAIFTAFRAGPCAHRIAVILFLVLFTPSPLSAIPSGLIGAARNHHTAGFIIYGVVLAVILWVVMTRGARAAAGSYAFCLGMSYVPPLLTVVITAASPVPPAGELPGECGPQHSRPHIVHLVLDGRGRDDLLSEIYGYNSGLSAKLRGLGFFVADRAWANYPQTVLSLASSLNADYLHDLGLTDRRFANRTALNRALANNRVSRYLARCGYERISFQTGYGPTEAFESDRRLAAFSGNSLTEGLLSAQFLPGIRPFVSRWLHARHARRIRFTLTSIPQELRGVSPRYIFAHVIAPHPPFVFRGDGAPSEFAEQFAFNEGQREIDPLEYRTRYAEQARYLDQLVAETVERSLSEAARPVVFILHGDHGPGSSLQWAEGRIDLAERFGILNAVYLPSGVYADFDEHASPVNNYRRVFRALFGAQLHDLPDRSWFSNFYSPFELRDVTDQLR